MFSLLLALALLSDTCSDCAIQAEEAVLCTDHSNREDEALAGLVPELLRGETEAQRLAALEAIAGLTEEHSGVPSVAVAEALARGLEDESFEVRRAAVLALGKGQDRRIAVTQLVRAMKEHVRTVETIEGRLEKLREELRDQRKDSENPLESMERTAAIFAEMAEEGDVLVERTPYQKALIATLASLPDDRSVKALVDLLGEGGGYRDSKEVTHALMAFGDRESFEGCFAAFEGRESMVEDQEDRIKKLRRGRAGRKEKGFKGSQTQWEESFEQTRASNIEVHEANIERILAAMRDLHERLAATCDQRGLPSPPTWSETPSRDWSRWLKKNADRIPDGLGEVGIVP